MVVNIVFAEEIKVTFDLSLHTNLSDFTLETLAKIDGDIQNVHKQYAGEIDKILDTGEFESFRGFVYNDKVSVFNNITEYIDDLEEELSIQLFNLKEHAGSIKEWIWKENVKKLKKLINLLKKLRTKLRETTFLEVLKFNHVAIHQKLGYYETLVMLYIYNALIGFQKIRKFEYCVVDEGQDFSILEYLVLSKAVINGRFCILGDLNQSYQDDGLVTWDDIGKVISEAKTANTFMLDTNYRSTKPIIEMANHILKPYTKDYLPKSINRKGIEPVIEKLSMEKAVSEEFEKKILPDLRNLDKSIGVICFNQKLVDEAEKIIAKANLPEDVFIKLDDRKRITYLPKGVYLMRFEDCKGLEFSKVYVLGLNLDKIDNYTDAKKAFVAVTRAMNEVTVLGVL